MRRLEEKELEFLGKCAYFDVEGKGLNSSFFYDFIYPASTSRGSIPLFKILLTNFCQHSCLYCINRIQMNTPRFFLKPYIVAKSFMEFYRRGLVKGLFLSSGIYKNPDFTQERILDVLYILRKKFAYQGFIHCKILPGVSLELVKSLRGLADRVSINLEASSSASLKEISLDKKYRSLLVTLGYLSRMHRKGDFPQGVTTQMIVGAGSEKDRDILKCISLLIKNFSLRRVYLSRFIPIKNTPLENRPPSSCLRERRLYQAEFLIRRYGFNYEDFLYDEEGNLSLQLDPKMGFAIKNRELFPLNINEADFRNLIKIPGIGPGLALRIIKRRKEAYIRNAEELRRLGINVKRVKRYVRF